MCRDNLAELDYSNQEGTIKEGLSIGNAFDRYKWSGTAFTKLKDIPQINTLWKDIIKLYTTHAAIFMRDRGFPEDVSCPPHKPCPSPPHQPCPTSNHMLLEADFHLGQSLTCVVPKECGLRCSLLLLGILGLYQTAPLPMHDPAHSRWSA